MGARGALNASPISRLDRRPRRTAKRLRATRATTEPASGSANLVVRHQLLGVLSPGYSLSFTAIILSYTHAYRIPVAVVYTGLSHTSLGVTPARIHPNRSIPGIKIYRRWGWFRGVAAVDRGDHGTSRFFKKKSRDLARGLPLEHPLEQVRI